MIMINGWDGLMGMTNYTRLDRDGLKYQYMICIALPELELLVFHSKVL